MTLNLSDQIIRNSTLLHPSPKMERVAGTVDFIWPAKTSVIIRMMANDGEHIAMPWWSVLRPESGEPIDQGFRENITITNARFLFGSRPQETPEHGLGLWGFSWYFFNHGETSTKDVRLEVGFVTTAMHPPATDGHTHVVD